MSKLYRILADDEKRKQLESFMYQHLALIKQLNNATSEQKVLIADEIKRIRQQRDEFIKNELGE